MLLDCGVVCTGSGRVRFQVSRAGFLAAFDWQVDCVKKFINK